MTKKELQKISLQYRTLASQMLKINSQEEMYCIQQFFDFINETSFLMSYIEECITEEYDFKSIFEEKDWRDILHLPSNQKELISYTEEMSFVAGLTKKIHEENPDDSICVIARNNRLLETAFEEAEKVGVECEKSKRKTDFETPYVLLLYLLLKLANHRNDIKVLKQIIAIFEQALLISINLEEVLTNAELSNQDYMSALSEEIKGKLGDDNFEKSFELELSEGKNFISFIQKAFDWSENRIDQIEDESHKEQAKQEFLIEKKIWTDFERHLSYNYDLDEITVATYMQEFAMISKESEPAKDAVQFLTIHASKGKEFDHVILIGMVNDELPSFQSMKKGIDSVEMEEERRNCFVAITRTQKKLYLTYSAKYYGWRKNPSLFLNEMFS